MSPALHEGGEMELEANHKWQQRNHHNQQQQQCPTGSNRPGLHLKRFAASKAKDGAVTRSDSHPDLGKKIGLFKRQDSDSMATTTIAMDRIRSQRPKDCLLIVSHSLERPVIYLSEHTDGSDRKWQTANANGEKSGIHDDNDSDKPAESETKTKTKTTTTTTKKRTTTKTTSRSSEEGSGNKRTIATYWERNFYSKDLSWQTNLVSESSLDSSSDSSGGDDDRDDERAGKSCHKQGEPLESGSFSKQERTSIRYEEKRESRHQHHQQRHESHSKKVVCDNLMGDERVVSCATAVVSANFSKLNELEVALNKKDDFEAAKDRKLSCTYLSFSTSEPTINTKSASSSGFSSTGTYATADNSSVRLKLSGSGADDERHRGSSGGRLKRLDHRQASEALHLSIYNLRLLLERNLVATLVGVYILVSLTVIMVLILPYLLNLTSTQISLVESSMRADNEPSFGYKRLQESHLELVDASVQTSDEPPTTTTATASTTTTKTTTAKLSTSLLLTPSASSPSSLGAKSVNLLSSENGGMSELSVAHEQRLSHHHLAQPHLLPATSGGRKSAAPEEQLQSAARRHQLPVATAVKQADNQSPASMLRRKLAHQHQAQHQQTQPFVGRPIIGYVRVQSDSGARKWATNTSGGDNDGVSTKRDLWSVAHNRQCQSLQVPFCGGNFESLFGSKGSLGGKQRQHIPYDMTLLPNQFTRNNESYIQKLLSRYEPIVDIRCYALMPLFLCSIYAPKCVPINQTQVEFLRSPPAINSSGNLALSDDEMIRGSESWSLPDNPPSATTNSRQGPRIQGKQAGDFWSRLVPPCRSLCKEAFLKCTFFFEVLSLKFLDQKQCDTLPESSDPNVCLGQHELGLLQETLEIKTCPADKFRCTSGECIPRKWRCDGFADCTDKSDEDKCSKCNGLTQFYCGQEICINKEQVCNGIRDCRDGRDERQCLRLSRALNLGDTSEGDIVSEKGGNGTNNRPTRLRRLEVWRALDGVWEPVCGAYWSPMPMSHEACQALGYSRANQTFILFEPDFAKNLNCFKQSPSLEVTKMTSLSTETARNRSCSSHPVQAAIQAPVNSAPAQTTTLTTTTKAADDALAGIFEDMLNHHHMHSANRARKTATVAATGANSLQDHLISYWRLVGADQAQKEHAASAEPLSAVYATETKLKSLTSMLYHGPQAGCADKASHLISTVYLECQNFQCGRSVTSYSSRVELQQQIGAAGNGGNSKRSTLSLHDELPSMADSIADKSKLARSALGAAKQERHNQMLEADEELSQEDDDVVYNDTNEELLMIDELARQQQMVDLDKRTSAAMAPISSRLVVGGIESMPGEFPYLAALHGGPDEVFFCGGVLIGINWLLTAAHCVGNRSQPDGWMVKVGVTRRIASPAFVKKLRVRRIIKHPKFNHEFQFNNDIALILLEESVEFNQYLRPICLPQANLKLGPDNSKDCVVVGFGKSKYSQEANYLHVAHFVNVPIVKHSVCSSWYAAEGVNLTDGMLCAGYPEGQRDACQGDSGSGLFCRYSNTNQFYVAGVVSFGIKCATPKLPGVYTSVPLYVDWIEATTRQHDYPLD